MQIKKYILLLASVLFVVACSNDDFTHQEPIQDGPVKVGFWMGRGDSENTRTFINDDGQTISWEAEDKVALWAQKDNVYTFQNQTFDTWFVAAETNQAFFTTTLPEAMPEGTYTYYACYPKPQSVSGTTATFTLPSMQDGKMGGGADIMVAQGTGPALEKLYTPADPNNSEVVPDYIIEDGLTLNMHHLIHALRFYVPAGKWGFPTGETVERIVFTMPANVAGTVTADVSNTNGLTLTSGGTNTISLNLKEPIGASTADNGGNVTYDYAAATIHPGTYSGNMTVKVYSQTKASQVTIPIDNRKMAAGHITPVGLNCLTVTERPKISFRIASNNLGEQPYRITLTSEDSNTKWKAGDDHVYEYYTGSDNSTIAVGSGFDIYYDEDVLSTISGKSVTVTYESKSAIVTETITMPTMSVGNNYNVNLNVPYLFFEDFSSVSAYNYAKLDWTSDGDTGISMDDVGLMGWTGAAWQTTANTSLTVAAYIGSSIGGSATDCSNGRVDTSTLPLKAKNVTISVSYMISGKTSASEAKNSCYFGTTTTAGAINATTSYKNPNKPDNLVDNYEINNGGSATSISTSKTHKVSGCSSSTRLTWCCNPTDVGTGVLGGYVTSKYFYIYLDNIKVQIVSE